MELFKRDKIYDFMSKRRLFIGVSFLFVFLSLVSIFTKGLNFGIDFAGGTIIQVRYDKKAPIDEIRERLKSQPALADAFITEFGRPEEIVIRTKSSSSEIGSDLADMIRQTLHGTGNFEIRRVDMVGSKVGSELRSKGLMALVVSIIGILAYVAIRFDWHFAIASIIPLVHDIIIAVGAISFFQIDVNLDILAALLTLVGYSLNDTIIVFDRIREMIMESKSSDLKEIINDSISRTLSRTVLTSMTVFFVVVTLLLFGGEIIYGFSFTMVIGVIIGTYSSIYTAAPLLMWLRFDVEKYRAKEAEKQRRKMEKERLRSLYEKGTL